MPERMGSYNKRCLEPVRVYENALSHYIQSEKRDAFTVKFWFVRKWRLEVYFALWSELASVPIVTVLLSHMTVISFVLFILFISHHYKC